MKDSDISTACQSACPTNAITFGDTNNAHSEVSEVWSDPRSFGVIEAVWLVKNEKLAGKFSELTYSNYEELKSSLPITYLGEKQLNTVQQFLCIMGLKKIRFR
mgnify:CR=1 FL=1